MTVLFRLLSESVILDDRKGVDSLLETPAISISKLYILRWFGSFKCRKMLLFGGTELLPPAYEVRRKVMFSVCLFTRGRVPGPFWGRERDTPSLWSKVLSEGEGRKDLGTRDWSTWGRWYPSQDQHMGTPPPPPSQDQKRGTPTTPLTSPLQNRSIPRSPPPPDTTHYGQDTPRPVVTTDENSPKSIFDPRII